MRISTREKLLLIFMITVLGSWFLFDFLIEEQLTDISTLQLEQKLKEVEKAELVALLSKEDELDEEIKNDFEKIDLVAKEYFNTTPQEEMILLFNDFLQMPGVVSGGLTFTESNEELVKEVPFAKQSISMTVSGQYLNVLSLLKTVWAFPQELQVSNISMSAGGYDEVSATVTIDTYTFMAETQVVDGLYQWYSDELFFKDNPFRIAEESDGVLRYLYLPDDTIFNYGRFFEFADVEGHWLQAEIEEYLDLGYLYLTPTLEFGADEPITRGEMIVLIDNVYDWEIDEYAEEGEETADLTSFRDYEDLGSLESSFAKAIHKGFLSGFVEGFADNTLRPRDPMTYAEVEFLMRRIKDDSEFTWESVTTKLGYMSGETKPEWTTNDGLITKAEAVYLLYYYK